MATPLEYRSAPATPAKWKDLFRFCLLATANGVGGLAYFCLLDLLLVRYGVRLSSGSMLLYVPVAVLAGMVALRRWTVMSRVVGALWAMVVGGALGLALIATAGLQFHSAIGGQM